MHRVVVIAVIAAAPLSGRAATAIFTPLDDLPGGAIQSNAMGVSPNGQIVVGSSHSANGAEAFRWSAATGMVALGDLPGGEFRSIAHAVTDAGVAVGYGTTATRLEAVTWSGAGPVGIGNLTGGPHASQAYGVSADGGVVVGFAVTEQGMRAFRWTAGGGMTSLGDLPGGIAHSIAYGVSADGLTVAGASHAAPYPTDDPSYYWAEEAFGWNSGSGMTGLGDLSGGPRGSWAKAISGDGATAVGSSYSEWGSRYEAFRYTTAAGMTPLGVLAPLDSRTEATAVSYDGSVIVGYGITAGVQEPFVWTENYGMRRLDHLLTSVGLDLSGWSLTTLNGVSADGLVMVGYGINPAGNFEGFRLQFSGLPIPGDYNADGTVDAADYTVWRDTLGSTTSLRADADDDGVVGQGDYAVWREHYGLSEAVGFRVEPAPEPSSSLLTALAGLGLAFVSRLRGFHSRHRVPGGSLRRRQVSRTLAV